MSENSLEPHRAGITGDALPELPRSNLYLVLDNIRSAFNVGALFRTADACATTKIFLLGLTPHPPQKQLEKTALGSTNYVPWVHSPTTSSVVEELEDEGVTLIALDNGPGAVSLFDFHWPEKVALIAGNEVQGVSDEWLSLADRKVYIPMFGFKRSLNVTTTLGIAMYDYLRTFRGGQG